MNDTESGLPSRSRIADLERLLDVARHLGATVDLDALLETIAVAATSVLDCERATVYLYDRPAGELCSRLATGIADSPINEIRFPVSRGIAGEVARTGHSVNLPDAYTDPRFNPDFDRVSGFRTRSMLAVRLADHDDQTVGVLQLLNKRSGTFDARDEEVAGFLGGQAGVAIQRQSLLHHFAEKQRIERDLSIARSIQQGLLPREQPSVTGFDIAGWNQPADETGGDFYDFFPLPTVASHWRSPTPPATGSVRRWSSPKRGRCSGPSCISRRRCQASCRASTRCSVSIFPRDGS